MRTNPWTASGLIGLLLALAIAAAMLASCGTTAPLHDPERISTESPEITAARTAIDEANGILIAVNNRIGDNAAAEVWTKAEAQGYLDRSKELGKKLDQARELLRLGNPADAQAQAVAIKTLILALQTEIAKRARQEN